MASRNQNQLERKRELVIQPHPRATDITAARQRFYGLAGIIALKGPAPSTKLFGQKN